MKYFGTDGIRGIVEADLNKKIMRKLAKAIVKYYQLHKLKKYLLVGNDTRISSSYILTEISSILLKNGIEIHNLGMCSSPCLAFITKKYNYPISLMITASHNPSEYNGLKFFNFNGEKVDDNFEEEIEFLMDKKFNLSNNNFAALKNVEELQNSYILHVKTIKKFQFSCIIDCANGATSKTCKSVFKNCKIINSKTDGISINKNSGCTSINNLKQVCLNNQMLGFALDGDGDRVCFVSERGEIVNGDKILYLLSKFFVKNNACVVGTIYTNSTLEKLLKKRNISLIRTNVGDKNIYAEMLKNNHILGGEESGHIILKPYSNTGDGVLIAVIICNLLALTKRTLTSLLKDYNEEHQLRENLKLTKQQINGLNLEKIVTDFSTSNLKVIIRPSGTEPVLRLFVESPNLNLAKETILNIKRKILELLT